MPDVMGCCDICIVGGNRSWFGHKLVQECYTEHCKVGIRYGKIAVSIFCRCHVTYTPIDVCRSDGMLQSLLQSPAGRHGACLSAFSEIIFRRWGGGGRIFNPPYHGHTKSQDPLNPGRSRSPTSSNLRTPPPYTGHRIVQTPPSYRHQQCAHTPA
jgi:hypothetical protein